METLFQHINHWHWWSLAIVLLILEAVVPGFFFLWMGISAGVMGAVLLLVPGLAWEYQVLGFAVLSVASIVAWRAWFGRNPTPTDQPALNRRGEQYVGRVFTLSEGIVDGAGKIRVDDSTWKVVGEECPAGARVRVTSVDGVILKVERA